MDEDNLWSKQIGETTTADKNSPDINLIVVELNYSGIVIHANEKCCQLLGYDKKEIIGKDWFSNFFPKRISEEIKRYYSDIMSSKVELVPNAEYYKNPVLTKSGEEIEILWHNNILRDSKGVVQGGLSIGENIQETRKIRENLQHNYDIMQAINFTLQMYMEKEPLDKIFGQVLDVFMSISWLSSGFDGCAILLADKKNPEVLMLKAQKGIIPPIMNSDGAANESCHCVKSMQLKQLLSSDLSSMTGESGDKNQELCVPIFCDEKVYGVLTVFLKQGFKPNMTIEGFLKSVSNALAIILKKKDDEEKLIGYQRNLELKIKELEKFHKLTFGRELKMIELKKRLSELEKKNDI